MSDVNSAIPLDPNTTPIADPTSLSLVTSESDTTSKTNRVATKTIEEVAEAKPTLKSRLLSARKPLLIGGGVLLLVGLVTGIILISSYAPSFWGDAFGEIGNFVSYGKAFFSPFMLLEGVNMMTPGR